MKDVLSSDIFLNSEVSAGKFFGETTMLLSKYARVKSPFNIT
jgi:hypothetical protein